MRPECRRGYATSPFAYGDPAAGPPGGGPRRRPRSWMTAEPGTGVAMWTSGWLFIGPTRRDSGRPHYRCRIQQTEPASMTTTIAATTSATRKFGIELRLGSGLLGHSAEVERADTGGRCLGALADMQTEPVNGERIRQRRRFEIDVAAPVEVWARSTVDSPAATASTSSLRSRPTPAWVLGRHFRLPLASRPLIPSRSTGSVQRCWRTSAPSRRRSPSAPRPR